MTFEDAIYDCGSYFYIPRSINNIIKCMNHITYIVNNQNFSSIVMCVTATWATEKTEGQSDQPGTISSEADKGTWRGVEAT